MPLRLLLLLALALLMTGRTTALAQKPEPPQAVLGVLDLRQWNFEQDGPVPLAGAWRVHWGRLTQPGDLLPADRFITLPGSWARLAQAKGSALGAATLRLRVLLPADAPPLAVLTPIWHAAFRLWIGDTISTAVGVPGLTAETEQARASVTTLPMPLGETNIGLTLQISNNFHYEGGPNRPILLGLARDIGRPAQIVQALNLIVLGGAIVLGLWHLTLVVLRRNKGGQPLFGALTLVLIVMVTCITDLHFFLFSDLEQQIGLRLTHVSLLALVVLFAWVTCRLFWWPPILPFLRALTAGAILVSLAVIVLPIPLFTQNHVAMLLLTLGALAVMILSIFKSRKPDGSFSEGAGIVALMLALALPLIINYVLYAVFFVDTIPTGGIAPLLIALGLQLVISVRNAHAVQAVERLSGELAALNQALEARVAARTAALEAVDRQRTRLFSVIAHDLRGPFNTLMGLSEAMLVLAEQWNRDRLLDMTGRLHQAASQVHALLDTLLEWAKLHMSATAPTPTPFALDRVAQRVVSSANPQAVQKGILLSCRTAGTMQVVGDARMSEIILRNLIGNALKFTRPGGQVVVSVARDAAGVRLSVRDSGVGIPPARLAALLSGEDQSSTIGTAGEPGTGLGLMLCRELADKLDAKLEAESTPGVGSTFSLLFAAPVDAVKAETA